MKEPNETIQRALVEFFEALAFINGAVFAENALPYIEEVLREQAPMRAHTRNTIRELGAILQRVTPPGEGAAH